MTILFAIPAIAGVFLLLVARREVPMSIPAEVILILWYALGFYLQYFGRSPARSATGLVMLCGLAIYLALRLRIGITR